MYPSKLYVGVRGLVYPSHVQDSEGGTLLSFAYPSRVRASNETTVKVWCLWDLCYTSGIIYSSLACVACKAGLFESVLFSRVRYGVRRQSSNCASVCIVPFYICTAVLGAYYVPFSRTFL